MKNSTYLIFIIVLLGCASDSKLDCSDIACTEEFKTITVSIEDENGDPVALDRFEVISIDSGKDITRDVSDTEYELMKKRGIYPLFGDENRNEYENQEIEISFRGYIDNVEVVNSNYIVGADCCHVNLVEGDTEINGI